MGGGSKRGTGKGKGRSNNNNNKSNSGGSGNGNPKSRKRGSDVKTSLFVDGGFLSDWNLSPPTHNLGRNGSSKNKSERAETSASKKGLAKSSGATIGYCYPSADVQEVLYAGTGNTSEDGKLNQPQPIILVDSKQNQIIAHVDQTPPSKSNSVQYTYSYDADFVLGDSSHRGLGFPAENDKTPSGIGTSSEKMPQSSSVLESSSSEKDVGSDEDMKCELSYQMTEDLPSKVSAERNSGFLSIGGLKLYTKDISDTESEEDDNEESPDEESSVSSDPEEFPRSSASDNSEDTSDSDSDIDEEVAEDYLEGVGGSDNIIDAKWLLKPDLDESDDDSSSSSCYDEALEKLGGIALQEASREYGKRKKVKPWKKRSEDSGYFVLDDLMLENDPRTISARKKHVPRLPHSWPNHAQKSKASKKIHGEKKKLRKERIAAKRRERMLHRGVDLEKINSKLEQIVLNEVDMFCFQPMHSRDCAQVQRLAAVYQLQSSRQGSGKKRFVTVIRTRSTSMPSSSGRQHLEKLIGVDDEDADFSVTDYMNKKSVSGYRRLGKKNAKRNDFRLQEPQSAQNKTSKLSASRGSGKMKDKKGSGRKGYANQPVSFVSSGTIHSETVQVTAIDSEDTNSATKKGATASANIGSFEVHTTGFGSKMMAKMGFMEGTGLGKNGQGMAEPIEVVRRPKSLGLGVQFSSNPDEPATSTIEPARSKSSKIGGFEKHTKGFGSKMMAKMGFIEGTGLGRESQGITTPLSAVRLPKSRGLGAKS